MGNIVSILLFIILLSKLILSTAEENIDGYCDKQDHSCDIRKSDEKYILYSVNPPEGFNLRRDVYMRFAIMLAEARNQGNKGSWRLILPPWYKLYHWKSDHDLSSPVPWSKFFDVDSLATFAPVVELHEVFSKAPAKHFKIDTIYALENFEDPFEDGMFIDKWEINKECNYYDNLWDYSNITANEIVCVKFQGKISKLWELVALHPTDKIIMFAHGEIPLHDHYGSKMYWDCRKSMKFNHKLIQRAQKFIFENFNCYEEKCSTYISVHLRRQDFARLRKKDVPSIEGTVKQLDNVIKKHYPHIANIFVASDGQDKELVHLQRQLEELNYKVHFYLPTSSEIDEFKDGGIAIIEQIICSHAMYFIGTHESTFSFRIQEEREILGFKSNTTFNRLCPDKGKCEKPSKWTIVN